jgi:hypothetical protein
LRGVPDDDFDFADAPFAQEPARGLGNHKPAMAWTGKCKQFSNRSATVSVINLIVVSNALATLNLFAFHLTAFPSRQPSAALLFHFSLRHYKNKREIPS